MAKRILVVSILLLAIAVWITLSQSLAEALEPDKDLQPPSLKPTIPVFDVPKVKVTAAGVIEKKGVTSYMYGTHVLKSNDIGGKSYALKSDVINLDQYVGEKITVTGEFISGYPVDGGPDYVNVESIAVMQSQ